MKSSSEAQYILVRDINIANGAVFVNETLNSDSYHVRLHGREKCVSSTQSVRFAFVNREREGKEGGERLKTFHHHLRSS